MTAAEPTRTIDLTVEIAAPVDDVWEAVATGDGIARWFAPIASVDEREGGTVTVAWAEGADWPSRITAWRPGEHLQMVDLSDAEAAAAGTALTVDYHLEDAAGKTRLRLVTSNVPGTPDWEDYVNMMLNGWRVFLWNLGHAVERHPGVARRMISVRPWVTGSREEVWERVFGAEGWGGGGGGGVGGGGPGGDPMAVATGSAAADSVAVGSATEGDRFRFVLDGGEVLEGVVVMCDRPWAFAGMVESLNDGVLHVEMEGSGERWRMGVWLSVYGVEEGWGDRMAAGLGGWGGSSGRLTRAVQPVRSAPPPPRRFGLPESPKARFSGLGAGMVGGWQHGPFVTALRALGGPFPPERCPPARKGQHCQSRSQEEHAGPGHGRGHASYPHGEAGMRDAFVACSSPIRHEVVGRIISYKSSLCALSSPR